MKQISRATTLFFLLLFFTAAAAQSQDWATMMQDPEAQFEDTRRAAEAWFEVHGTGKSMGWKPYKRWEHHMESRVMPDGSQRYPIEMWDEIEKYRETHPPVDGKRNSSVGNWTQLGPVTMPANGTGQPNGLGRIVGLAFHPADANTFYVGAAAGGFWTTTDYGTTWTESSSGLPYLGISAIVPHPSTPSTIYIGTGDRDGGDAPGRGVYRSTDNGANWSAWNSGMGNRTVYEILMHPSNSNIMIASCNGRIYRTTDGGSNWNQSYSGGENFKDIAFNPADPNIVYAASNDFYRSTDNGISWNQVTNGVPTGVSRIAIGVSPDEGGYVYLFAGDGGGFDGMYRSTDSGQNFTQRSNSPNLFGYATNGGTGSQAWYDIVMIVDPADADHLYTGAVNGWESFDGGVNWSIFCHWTGGAGQPDIHADIHNMEYNSNDGNLFVGCDGGLYFSADAGVNFTEISSGLAIAQVYKIGQSQTNRDLVINGYQDNGTAFYRDGNWYTEIGGDGMECIVDPTDETVMYGALYYGDVRRSTNSGATFSRIADDGTNGINESGAWVTPYKLHPTNSDAMVIGYRNLWYSTNVKSAATNAVTWTQISSLSTGATIRDIAIAPSDPNTIYFSRNSGSNFYRSTNALGGSATWTDLDGSLPANGFPRDIEIHPTDPQTLWIALGNNIYKSINGGNSWTDVSGTLPNIALNTIVFDTSTAATSEALYVGMDLGVYYFDNTLADWIQFDAGLPNTEVTELEIYYDPECRGNDMLRAGTYGRGLWESDLRDPGTLAPATCFFASPTVVCEGMVVTLEDFSAYGPTSWNWSISPATYSFENGTSASDQNPQVSFVAPGAYTVTLTATNGNGSDNRVRTGYINVTGAALGLPVTEDFESAATCGTASNCATEVCALPNGWTNLTNGTEDDIDWRVDNGGTPSTGTGPPIDYDPGTAGGNYVYLEASSCSGRNAEMVSPCLDLRTATATELDFAYHMDGSNMGELHLDVFSGGAWTEDVMPVISGDQGGAWLTRNVSLMAFDGNVIRLRFRGLTGTGYQSDMAIDGIEISASAVLPLSSFQFSGAYVPGMGNKLNWTLEGDIQAESFLVEKETPDGVGYLPLEIVSHTRKSGYSVVDPSPRAGINTYRLWLKESDGLQSFAGQVEIVAPLQDGLVKFYPNPTTGLLNMDVQSETTEVFPLRIIDMMGRELHRETVQVLQGDNHFNFDMTGWESGLYFVKYKREVVKIVKW